MSIESAMNPETVMPELNQQEIGARNRLVISLLLVSAFVVILNETIMSVALPRLMVALDIPASSAQWLTAAFMLTMAVVIPVTGYLLQRFNTRPVFILAMSLFSAGTLICAASPGFASLLVGRVVQASGTAIMMPLLMTTVMHLVPSESRGKTMGNISIVISVAPAIGPTISGLILSVLDWRWMFILVLPIALGALALGASKIRNVSTPRAAPIDVLSVILAAIGFGGLVYGLSGVGEAGAGEGGALSAWIPIVVGASVVVIFVLRQISLQKREAALLDLRTLNITNFSVSVAMMAVLMLALFGVMILLPIYLQNVVGLTTLQTGLMLLPGGLAMGLCAPYVGRLYDRHGPTVLVVPGAILVSAVMWVFTTVSQDTSIVVLLGAHLVLSLGLGLMFTPLFSASLGSLPPHLYSHGSAMIGTTQQVAGAAGTALFVALMTAQTINLSNGGAEPIAAAAGGIRAAFLCGAIISLFAVVGACFVRKPEGDPAHGPGPGH
ncbi:MDR family MFS transporter [Devosia rhodophyticola]|uniref:MDR family MFS transporter n=1 Tax=Devosia rhodophyticola TaxID=3026423 RepID=A0ABY7YZ46_9HYPH|nr:MDR family MFS transporter [Devosia rhodophyticola]WDR06526.1 MDR family MFS transporter [Devosia rhodophyticola]